MKAIYAVMNTTWAVVKTRPEINSGLYGIWTHDLCNTGAVLYQLSKQANWELVVMLVPNIPVKWWINECEYMKVIYLIYAVKCNIIRMKLFGVTLKLTSENFRLIKIENYDPKAFRKGRSIFIQGTIWAIAA